MNLNIELIEKVVVEENVENWLSSLSKFMVNTLRKLLNESLLETSLEVNKYPS